MPLSRAAKQTFFKRAVQRRKRQDPEAFLKERLVKAKNAENYTLCKKIRQDIYVLKDVSNGHKPPLDQKELDESLRRLPSSALSSSTQTSSSGSGSVLTSQQKQLRNRKKKLREIDALKERLRNGGKLESNQIEKIAREDELLKEVADLKKLSS